MSELIAAYLLLWLGVVWYVLRLGAAQRRLERALNALQVRADQPEPCEHTPARPA